jgi:hypothetical protein
MSSSALMISLTASSTVPKPSTRGLETSWDDPQTTPSQNVFQNMLISPVRIFSDMSTILSIVNLA